MLYMEPFSVAKIKFKMQFCNLDDLGLTGSILPNLNHFAQYWFILLDLNQLSSRNFGHL